jgi:hypothetical protein
MKKILSSATMTPFNVEEAAEEVGNFKSDTLSIFKILNLGFVFFKIWDLDLRVMMIMPLMVMNIGLIPKNSPTR